LEKAKSQWEALQIELGYIGRSELENYPVNVQKHLNKFRNVNFEWMMGMLIEYYRGTGGLDSMYVILPPIAGQKEKKK